jgi:uncharacterized protein (TIGR00251 family)
MHDKTTSPLDEQPSFVRRVADGIELRLKVVPGASRSQIVGKLGDRLKIRVAAAPEQGKANRAVIRLLSDWLGVNGIEIIAGDSSPEKTASVPGLSGLSAEQLRKLAT